MQVEIEGFITREIYSNRGVSIISCATNENRNLKARWQNCSFHLRAGINYKMTGYYFTHEKYGQQFEITHACELPRNCSKDVLNAMKLLKTPMKYKPEIGEQAIAIVNKMGGNNEFLKTILNDVMEDDLFNKYRVVEEIIKTFKLGEKGVHFDKKWVDTSKTESSSINSLLWLVVAGFSSKEMEAISQYASLTRNLNFLYPKDMLDSNRIWRYLDPVGVSILPVDRIALEIGTKPSSVDRIARHMVHAIQVLSREEHHLLHSFIGIGSDSSKSVITRTIKTCENAIKADSTLDKNADAYVRKAYKESMEEDSKLLVEFPSVQSDDGELAVPKYMSSGALVSQEMRILDICRSKELGLDKPESEIRDLIKTFDWELSDEQKEGIVKIFNGVSVITGGPGTGKTTMMRGVRDVLEHYGFRVIPLAPTGKAARRLQEQIKIKARTIHKFNNEITHLNNKEINYDHSEDDEEEVIHLDESSFIIIDEMSMVSLDVLNMALNCVNKMNVVGILFVGDINQLPPIGVGAPFCDMVSYLQDYIPITKLTEVFRQKDGGEDVAKAAESILNGEVPESSGGFEFIEATSDHEVEEMACSFLYDSMDHEDPYSNFQMISARRNGNRTVYDLNVKHVHSLNMSHQSFQEDDKVMQIENDYDKDIMNGEIGKVVNVNEVDDIDVLFEGHESTTKINGKRIRNLERAWAITIHKCQGSEYDEVIIPIFTEHKKMWEDMPALLYTAVSRGKKKVKVIATRETFRSVCMAGINKSNVVRTTAWYLDKAGVLDDVMTGSSLREVLKQLKDKSSSSNKKSGKLIN